MRIRLRQLHCRMLSDTDVEDTQKSFIRLIEIEKNNNSQCGFRLTRGKWDPYPWVGDVDEGTAAHTAGLKPGDCVLEVNGKDVVGMKICDIAEIVKSKNEQVSLLLWNAGIEPNCTAEAICCGPLPKNLQRLSVCMSKILAFLECPVCLDTIPPPAYQCDNGHLICMRCRSRSEKCPVCRQRLQRGRSLLSDQVYHAVTDTFGLKEDNEEIRAAKIQQIFKNRNRKPNVPDIKVTHTNKFLSRIIGKASSVDNLSSNSDSNNETRETLFPDTSLRTKSLSTNEIFMSGSPAVSRSGSVSRINRKPLQTLSINCDITKPASYHGSFESLERKIEHGAPENKTLTINTHSEEKLCNCPFVNSCSIEVKESELFEHFRKVHAENGPLIQYFSSQVKYSYKDLENQQEICHMINKDEDVFFLKICFRERDHQDSMIGSSDIMMWVWFYGSKEKLQKYQVTIELVNIEDVLLRVQIPIFSLSTTSITDVLDFKKCAYISSKTLQALGFNSGNIFLHVKILNNDNEIIINTDANSSNLEKKHLVRRIP